MDRRFWGIGSQYEDCTFARVIEGTTRVDGPYRDHAEARAVWALRSAETRCIATIRFAIVADATPQERARAA